MIKKKLNQLSPFDVFLLVSISISTLFILAAIFTSKYFDALVMDSSFLFSDYFYHIAGSSDTANMYSYGDPYSFPPFAYLMYSLLWNLTPYKDGESILNWKNFRDYDNALVVFVVYNLICVIFLIYCIGQYFQKNNAKYTLIFPIALVVSYPFMCTSIQRGNVCLLVAIMLALAWIWMDSENKIKQEIALLLIASAAGFKLYPAIFGLLFVKRKDWKKVLRLIVYGILAIFAPFSIFGGIDGLKNLIHTLTGFATYIDPDKKNTISGMAKWLGLKLNMAETVAENFGIGINWIFFFTMIFFFFLGKKKWQEILFLTAITVSFVASNWEYTSVYYLGVLLLFFKENDSTLGENNWKRNIYLIGHSLAFGLIFSADFLMIHFRYGLVAGIFMTTYLIITINMGNVMMEAIPNIRRSI